MQIAQQARNERGQKLFETSRQGENEVFIASAVRWDTQLKGLVELERRCQEMLQEVKLLSERHEVLAGLVEDKIRLQSKATEKYYETIFEELRKLEEKKSKEALLLVQKRHILIRYQSERDKAGMLQRLGGSRAMRNGLDTQDTLSFESCSSSMSCDMEEVSSESSKMMKDVEETTSEASWTAVTKGKGKELWRLDPEGEAEKPEVTVLWNEAEGVSVNPEGKFHHEQT